MPISAKAIKAQFPEMSTTAAKDLSKLIREEEGWTASGKRIEDLLEFANKVIGGFGVEVIRGSKERAYDRFWMDAVAAYVNLGDTYTTTILFDTVKGRFYLQSWGDFVERNEKRYGIE